ARAACDRAWLQEKTTALVAAQTAGTPIAADSYIENKKSMSIASGILSKALKVDHQRSTYDTTECATFTELIVTDPVGYVIGFQQRFAGNATNVESIVTTQGDWLFNAKDTLKWASQEKWDPVTTQDTRAVIKAAGDAYLDLFNDKSVVVPWGTPCARLEGGAYTGKNSPTDSCNVGVPSGVQLTRRRYVIDEVLGTVDVFLDFGGTNGGLPDSHEFRVENGKLRYVHTMT
ncbi:hypothetical protein M501DRAFT_902654, partial [Patellaria atrata CBS 101060]